MVNIRFRVLIVALVKHKLRLSDLCLKLLYQNKMLVHFHLDTNLQVFGILRQLARVQFQHLAQGHLAVVHDH